MVVGEDREGPAGEDVAEESDREVDTQELSIKG